MRLKLSRECEPQSKLVRMELYHRSWLDIAECHCQWQAELNSKRLVRDAKNFGRENLLPIEVLPALLNRRTQVEE